MPISHHVTKVLSWALPKPTGTDSKNSNKKTFISNNSPPTNVHTVESALKLVKADKRSIRGVCIREHFLVLTVIGKFWDFYLVCYRNLRAYPGILKQIDEASSISHCDRILNRFQSQSGLKVSRASKPNKYTKYFKVLCDICVRHMMYMIKFVFN